MKPLGIIQSSTTNQPHLTVITVRRSHWWLHSHKFVRGGTVAVLTGLEQVPSTLTRAVACAAGCAVGWMSALSPTPTHSCGWLCRWLCRWLCHWLDGHAARTLSSPFARAVGCVVGWMSALRARPHPHLLVPLTVPLAVSLTGWAIVATLRGGPQSPLLRAVGCAVGCFCRGPLHPGFLQPCGASHPLPVGQGRRCDPTVLPPCFLRQDDGGAGQRQFLPAPRGSAVAVLLSPPALCGVH